MDAFLSQAPLDYLELLFELQTSGEVRADIPVLHYLALRLAEDCNGNGIPDSYDIENATSPDVNENNVPDGRSSSISTRRYDGHQHCSSKDRCETFHPAHFVFLLISVLHGEIFDTVRVLTFTLQSSGSRHLDP